MKLFSLLLFTVVCGAQAAPLPYTRPSNFPINLHFLPSLDFDFDFSNLLSGLGATSATAASAAPFSTAAFSSAPSVTAVGSAGISGSQFVINDGVITGGSSVVSTSVPDGAIGTVIGSGSITASVYNTAIGGVRAAAAPAAY